MASKRRRSGERPRPGGSARLEAVAGELPATRALPIWAVAALLAIAATWAYGPSLSGVLLLDDIPAIVHNRSIRTLWPPWGPLSPPTGTTVSGRPVANLSLALNYALAPTSGRFPQNIRGYHLLNLAIHIAAGLTLFGILRRTLVCDRLRHRFEGTATPLALVVSLVWLLHPLQTAAVTYVVQRVESLMGLFYLLTLYSAIRAHTGQRTRFWTIGAIVCCGLGMATKEVMVTAPILVGLWYHLFARNESHQARRRLLGGLAATWLILAALVFHEHRAPSIELGLDTIWRYLLTQTEVVTHYLRLAVVPTPLVFLYTWPLVPSQGAVLVPAIFLTTLLGLTLLGLVHRHPLGFAGAWFFLIIAPSSSLLPIVTEVAAEHRMYLPLAAVVAGIVIGAWTCADTLLARVLGARPTRPRIGAAVAVVATAALVVSLGLATRARNRDYQSAERLWLGAVAGQPTNQRARVAYGETLATAGRLAEAEKQLRTAVELDTSDPVALVRLGSVQAAQGELDAAIASLEQALALRPQDLDAHRLLGRAFSIRRQDGLAVLHLRQALEVEGDDPSLLGELAMIRAESMDPSVRDGARAVPLAERAVRLTSRHDPRMLEVLAVSQAAAGRNEAAAVTAEEALTLARAGGDQELVTRLEHRVESYRGRRRFRMRP